MFVPQHVGGVLASFRLTGSTDNQGNSYVVQKLMSSKFPLCVVLMELVEQLDIRGAWLDLKWVPREENSEADDLSNFKVGGFSPDKELHVDLEALEWRVLPEFMQAGMEFQASRGRCRPPVKKARNDFRVLNPW